MPIELQSIISSFQAVDKWILSLINKEGSNAFFDWLLPYWRTPAFWAPAYLLLVLLVGYRLKRKALWWVFFFIATVSLVDFTGNQLIKQTIQRVRPCNDPTLLGEIILRIPHCGSGFSFISNHAANHFAMATFIFITLSSYLGKWGYLLFFWAFSVGYAQIYVGVHYPADVLAGSIFGLLIGWLFARQYNKQHRITTFEAVTSTPH
ncbi:MAG: phosphatase PAP2 family protein [Chitinophagaceae bacterium]